MAQPPAHERLRKVQRWIQEREEGLEEQHALAEAARIGAEGAEAALRVAEAELDFLADARNVRESRGKGDMHASVCAFVCWRGGDWR